MRFKDYFSNDFETSDNHDIPSLKSRYYRCRNDQGMDAIKQLASEIKAIVKYVDNERHEIIFESSRFAATATVISPTYMETSVDFKITTYSILPMGKGIKIITDFYNRLDKIIPFIDTGLYHGR